MDRVLHCTSVCLAKLRIYISIQRQLHASSEVNTVNSYLKLKFISEVIIKNVEFTNSKFGNLFINFYL